MSMLFKDILVDSLMASKTDFFSNIMKNFVYAKSRFIRIAKSIYTPIITLMATA
jgi:hypothetical protein